MKTATKQRKKGFAKRTIVRLNPEVNTNRKESNLTGEDETFPTVTTTTSFLMNCTS